MSKRVEGAFGDQSVGDFRSAIGGGVVANRGDQTKADLVEFVATPSYGAFHVSFHLERVSTTVPDGHVRDAIEEDRQDFIIMFANDGVA